MALREFLEQRRKFSLEKLCALRYSIQSANFPSDCAVVINGSFARGDATPESDVDYFVLHERSEDNVTELRTLIKEKMPEVITGAGLRSPSEDGAFAEAESLNEFLRNVGGTQDPNDKLTRRMLLMLEGDWLTNEALVNKARSELVNNVYIKDLDDHQLARFFLNDLVRYWRTIGVDFAFKTGEGSNPKPWGIRNLKLLFSRKLIYFSGILMAAETVQRTTACKKERLLELSRMTPIARVSEVCGAEADRLIDYYATFLQKMSDPQFRALAESTKEDRSTHSPDFRVLKDLGQHFSLELDRVLNARYGHQHPIHHALVF